jgi:hypothetical protein
MRGIPGSMQLLFRSLYKREQSSGSSRYEQTLGASIFKLKMIPPSPILYVFLVHVVVCTTAEGSERHLRNNASNQTRTLLSSQNDTYQNSTFASSKTNKECLLTVNETDLFSLQRLARSKVVHVVELDLQFPSNISNSMIKEWRWNLTNNVGQEILSMLAMKDMSVTWTLDVGRKTAKVGIFDEPPGCATSEKEPGDFIAGAILKQLPFADEKEMCFDKVSMQTRCCKIIGKDLLKYQCYVSVAGSEFVNLLESMLSLYSYCLAFGSITGIVYFGIFLQLENTNNTKGYYKLTKDPMAVSSILCMLFWDGYGRFKSFVRRCLLIVVLFLFFWQVKSDHLILSVDNFKVVYFSLWAKFYPFSSLFKFAKFPPDNRSHRICSPHLLKLFSYLGYDIHDVYFLARVNVSGAINLITLPVNVKRWKKSLARFSHNFIAPSTLGSSLKGKILLYSKTGVFCSCYIVFIFIMQVILVLVFTVESYFFVMLLKPLTIVVHDRGKRTRIQTCAISFCESLCMCYSLIISVCVVEDIPHVVISLLSGLILNVVYFSPYIVYISLFTFYSWTFWGSVQQQYVVLIRLIFDRNMNNDNKRNKNHNSNDNNNNNNNDNDNVSNHEDSNSNTSGDGEVNQEITRWLNRADTTYVGRYRGTRENNSVVDVDDCIELVSVVSEELYDKIREHLLPYHGNLFRFVLKIMCVSVFSYLTLTLVRILQPSDISPTVQALTTFSVFAFPYIMNTVAAKKSEEQKDAWKEQLKHCVELLVDKFTANNPELGRTQLIIRHQARDLTDWEDSRVHDESVV